METFIHIFQSPVVVTAAIIAFICIILQLVIDARRLSHRNALYNMVIAKAKVQNAKSFSVVIELRRSADTLFPLLDHLSSHKYAKLEIVVVIKQTAGTKAQGKLAAYRRRTGSNIRLIRHRKGMTTDSVVRRYATGKLALRLEPDDRLSKDFFTYASLQFISPALHIALPRQLVIIDSTLTSALEATHTIWKDTIRHLRQAQLPHVEFGTTGVIYNTTAVKTEGTQKARPAVPHAEYTQLISIYHPKRTPQKPSLRSLPGSITVAITTVAIILGLTKLGNDIALLLSFIAAWYGVMLAAILVGDRAYTVYQRLNMIVLSPFSLVYLILACILSLLQAPRRTNKSKRLRTYRYNPLRIIKQH